MSELYLQDEASECESNAGGHAEGGGWGLGSSTSGVRLDARDVAVAAVVPDRASSSRSTAGSRSGGGAGWHAACGLDGRRSSCDSVHGNSGPDGR